MKLKLAGLMLLLTMNKEAFGFTKKLDEIPAEDKKILDQVKIEKGGLIMFEQFLEKKEKYNHKDAYRVEFLCPKTSKSKISDCKIIKYEVLEKRLR